MPRRVLVTRPEPGASATAERLEAAGLTPIVLPLTRIEPLFPPLPEEIGQHQAVALTSANAIRCAPLEWLTAIAALPCFAVGEATASQARERELNVVAIGAGDGAGLARKIITRLSAGNRLLYLCGRTRSEGFEAHLTGAGITVTPVETYDAVAIDYEPAEIAARIGRTPPWAALIHSPAGGRLLAGLLSRPEIARHFAGMRVFGISANAVAALKGLPNRKIEVAREPSEAALLALTKAIV